MGIYHRWSKALKIDTLAKAVLSISSILLVFLFLDTEEIIKNVLQISPLKFLLAVFLNIGAFYIYALRWSTLIHVPKGNYNSSLGKYFFANYLNFFTPANLGGDIYRASAFSRPDLRTPQVLIFLIFERVAALAVFLFFLLLAFLSLDLEVPKTIISEVLVEHSYYWLVIFFLFILILATICIFFLKAVKAGRIAKWIYEIWERFTIKGFLIFFSLTTAGLAVSAGCFDLISSSLDLRVPYTAWLLAFIAAELSRWIPVSIQGIGIREATFASAGAAVMGEPEVFFLVGAAGYAAQSLAVAGSIFQAQIHYRLAK